MTLTRVAAAALVSLSAFIAMPAEAASIDYDLVADDVIISDAARVSWSHDGQWIYFDSVRLDAGEGLTARSDVYRAPADGSQAPTCLTCGHPALPNRDIGQPEIHPNGRWLVFQAELASHPASSYDGPGGGHFNNLWVIDTTDPTLVYQLTNVSNASQDGGGSLHAHFNSDGTKLMWGDRERDDNPYGDWRIAIAEFRDSGSATGCLDPRTAPPCLVAPEFLNPGPNPTWLETHDWGPDDSWILITCLPFAGMWDSAMDICRVDLDNPTELIRLTFTSGMDPDGAGPLPAEPRAWDEHAHLSPDGEVISWSSSNGYQIYNNPLHGLWLRTEVWLMNADGSSKVRSTNYNASGRVIVGDQSWNHLAPASSPELAIGTYNASNLKGEVHRLRYEIP